MKHILLAAAFAAFFMSNAVAQEKCISGAEFEELVATYFPDAWVNQELTPVPSMEGVYAIVFERPLVPHVLVVFIQSGCVVHTQEMTREAAYDLLTPGA